MPFKDFFDNLFKHKPAREHKSPPGQDLPGIKTEQDEVLHASKQVERRDESARRQETMDRRKERAAERLMENENLTGDLDDEAADPLINWGVSWAKQAAQTTAGLDDAQAEQVMADRMQTVQQMMRSVSRWALAEEAADATSTQALITKVAEQAAVIQGQDFSPPDSNQQQALMRELPEMAQDPARKIRSLQGLFDRNR
jgi:hypothetical protein